MELTTSFAVDWPALSAADKFRDTNDLSGSL